MPVGGEEGSQKKTVAELGHETMSGRPQSDVLSYISPAALHRASLAFLSVAWFPASPDTCDAIQCLADGPLSPRVLSSFQSLPP